jgi:hypothetical protein
VSLDSLFIFLKDINKIHNLVPDHASVRDLLLNVDLSTESILIQLLGIDVLALLRSRLIFGIAVKSHVGNELIDLEALEIGLLVLMPVKLGIIAVVKHIPESLLAVVPQQIINLIATSGGEIKISAL